MRSSFLVLVVVIATGERGASAPWDPATMLSPGDVRGQLPYADVATRMTVTRVLHAAPQPKNVRRLVDLLKSCPPEATKLREAARIALRNALVPTLKDPAERATWLYLYEKKDAASRADAHVIADAALGVPSWEAGWLLGAHIAFGDPDPTRLPEYVAHVNKYGSSEYVELWVNRPTVTAEMALDVLAAVKKGVPASGFTLSPDAYAAIGDAAERNGLVTGRVVGNIKIPGPPERPRIDVAELLPKLVAIATNPAAPAADRERVVTILAWFYARGSIPTLAAITSDPTAPKAVADRAAVCLAISESPAHVNLVIDRLETAPAAVTAEAAPRLASHKSGADALLTAVSLGKLSPRLLLNPTIAETLRARKSADLDARVAELTRGVSPADENITALIRARTAGFAKADADPVGGLAVFANTCAACHRIGDTGRAIAPRLDRIGDRGPARVIEDVLDPGWNVDAAFRLRTLRLTDGRLVQGTFVRLDGSDGVLANDQGKEVRVPFADVASWSLSPLSPMPGHVTAAVPEADFYDLIAFLLDQRTKGRMR